MMMGADFGGRLRRSASGLRARLLALVLLAVVPPIALVVDANRQAREQALQEARDELGRLAEVTASALKARVQGTRELLELFTRSPIVRQRNLPLVNDLCAELLPRTPDNANLGLADADGRLLADGLHPGQPTDLSGRAWFPRARASSQMVAGDYRGGAPAEEPTLDFALALRGADGSFVGVAWLAMRLTYLDELLGSLVLPEGAAVFVADAQGTVLARAPDSELWVGKAQSDHVMDSLPPGEPRALTEVMGVDGTVRLYELRRVEGLADGPLTVGIGVPRETVVAAADAPYRRALAGLVIVAVLALAASGLAAEVLLVRRFERLLLTVQRLAAGHEDQRTGLAHRGDEVGQLAQAVDGLGESLQDRGRQRAAAQAETRRLHADLERRVEARTAELKAVNAELEAFSYSVSHDLRAPVRHIAGFAALLERHAGPSLDAQGRKDLAAIHDAAQRMNRLIDDILAFSRLGRAGLRPERVELERVVRDAWRALEPETQGRAVELRLGPLPSVRGDARMLEQAFANLLSNSLKYTRPRERAIVEVAAGRDVRAGEPAVIVSVRDNGVGFDMQYADKLFGVFQRLHDPVRFEGTGIGLAIVRRVVERHGGRVWAQAALDEGATFFLSLPGGEHP